MTPFEMNYEKGDKIYKNSVLLEKTGSVVLAHFWLHSRVTIGSTTGPVSGTVLGSFWEAFGSQVLGVLSGFSEAFWLSFWVPLWRPRGAENQ